MSKVYENKNSVSRDFTEEERGQREKGSGLAPLKFYSISFSIGSSDRSMFVVAV